MQGKVSEATLNCAVCEDENPYIKYKNCQRDDDFAPSPSTPAFSNKKLLHIWSSRKASHIVQYMLSTRLPIHISFYRIQSQSYDKVRRPFWKSSTSSEYIEWVKLNIVPSHIYGALAKIVHMLKHTIFDYAGNGEGFFLLSVSCVLLAFPRSSRRFNFFFVYAFSHTQRRMEEKRGF